MPTRTTAFDVSRHPFRKKCVLWPNAPRSYVNSNSNNSRNRLNSNNKQRERKGKNIDQGCSERPPMIRTISLKNSIPTWTKKTIPEIWIRITRMDSSKFGKQKSRQRLCRIQHQFSRHCLILKCRQMNRLECRILLKHLLQK